MKKSIAKILEKIPSRIRIKKDIDYEIVYIENFQDDPRQVGEMRPDIQQIVVKVGINNNEKMRTIIHELLHTISDENDIKLTETQVEKLEDGIFKFCRLNGIFEFISKSL